MMRRALHIYLPVLAVLMLAGCRSMTPGRQDEMDRFAHHTIMKLKGDRPDVHGQLLSAPAYVAAMVDRGNLMEGFKPNGALVQQSDALNRYIILDQLQFDGAADVIKFNVVILLSESDLKQALHGELNIREAPDRLVYFCAREKRFAVYPLHSCRIRLVEE